MREARLEGAGDEFFADLLDLLETGHHLAVDLVYGAATDGVVGVVLHEQFPAVWRKS